MNFQDKIFFGIIFVTMVLASGLIFSSQIWWQPSTFQPQSLPTGRIIPPPPPEKQLTSNPSAETWPVWSPDNWHLAYMSNQFGNWSIWSMCEDGSKKQQLTSNNTVDMYPAWSPDGKRIAYLSYRSEASDIWVIYSDGTGKINLTDDEASEGTPVWSPDGSRLVFESDRSGNWDIWVISSTGYYISQLTTDPAVDRHPSWSPNGKKIVFDSNRTGNFDLWIMDPDGSNQTRLTTNSQDDIKPQVSPDGRWILYMSKRPTHYYLPRDGSWIYVDAFRRFGDWFLWKSTLDGKHHIELMFFLEEYSNPIWSSDGSQVVFAMHGYNWHGTFTVEALQEIDIFSTDPYRLELKQVVALAGDDLYPCLSPDGKKVLFASQESGNFDIWMISTSEVSEPPTY